MATESVVDAVKTILWFMERSPDERGKRLTMLSDLASKAGGLPEPLKWPAIARGLLLVSDPSVVGHLPQALVNEIQSQAASSGESEGSPQRESERHDIGIVTVIGAELKALQVALGIPQDTKGHLSIGAERYWLSRLRTSDGGTLRVVITVITRPRNVPTAILTERLVVRFGVKACLLVGIAAGVKGKVKLGDVVAAEAVIDYEHARLELEHPSKRLRKPLTPRKVEELLRPLQLEPPTAIKADTALFRLEEREFHRRWKSGVRQLELRPTDRAKALTWEPELHCAVTLAGEKLIADGSLVDRRIRLHEKVRAADQEDSGFAQACRYQNPELPWAVFRGISDYGDGGKGQVKRLQPAAAYSAAVAAVMFLESHYRKDLDVARKSDRARRPLGRRKSR